MIICVCRNITSEKIKEVKENGCTTNKDVSKYVQQLPKCGLCIPTIDKELKK